MLTMVCTCPLAAFQVPSMAPDTLLAAALAGIMLCVAGHMTALLWMAKNAFWMGAESEPRMLAVALRNEYEAMLRTCISEAINSGEFRKSNVAMTGRFLLSALNQISRWHNPKGAMSIREVIEQYLDMALHGLQAPAKA